MRHLDGKEVLAALAFIGFGAMWLVIGAGYSWGSSVRIGAAVFPLALSVILIVLCLVLIVQSRHAERRTLDFKFRPTALILGGIIVWALTVDLIGFLPATAILVALCAMAERESTWLSTVALTVSLCVFGYVVFLVALNIPLDVLGG